MKRHLSREHQGGNHRPCAKQEGDPAVLPSLPLGCVHTTHPQITQSSLETLGSGRGHAGYVADETQHLRQTEDPRLQVDYSQRDSCSQCAILSNTGKVTKEHEKHFGTWRQIHPKKNRYTLSVCLSFSIQKDIGYLMSQI